MAITCACIPIITSHIGLVMKQLRTRRSHSNGYSGSRGIRLTSQGIASEGQGDSAVNLQSADITTIEAADKSDKHAEMPAGQIRVETDLRWQSGRNSNAESVE